MIYARKGWCWATTSYGDRTRTRVRQATQGAGFFDFLWILSHPRRGRSGVTGPRFHRDIAAFRDPGIILVPFAWRSLSARYSNRQCPTNLVNLCPILSVSSLQPSRPRAFFTCSWRETCGSNRWECWGEKNLTPSTPWASWLFRVLMALIKGTSYWGQRVFCFF